jgi:hypothetical protein
MHGVKDTVKSLSYFFVDSLRFLRFLQQLSYPQSMQNLEKIVQLAGSHFSQTEHFIDSHSPFVTFFTAVAVIIFIRIA